MTAKTRKRRNIIYFVEQVILSMFSIGCFCAFLIGMRWIMEAFGV